MPRSVRWCLQAVTAAVGGLLAASYALCISRACSSSRFDIAFLSVLSVAAAATALSAVTRHRFAPAILAVLVPTFAALYLFEGTATSAQDAYARSLRDAIRDYRQRGIDAVPQWTPYGFVAGQGMLPLGDGTSVVPLTGPSERRVVMCREGEGPLATYQADHMGLNNPEAAWRVDTQIVFVGDSFTHGACVDEAAHFTHAVRQAYAGTINLGYSGNGPLTELAVIREYATRLRPRYVFWMYDEANDVLPYSPPPDLDVEVAHPIVSKYLQADFTQHLFARQALVNAGVNRLAEAWVQAAAAPPPWLWRLQTFLSLPTTREVLRGLYARLRVALPFALLAEPPVSPERMAEFATIVRSADDAVRSWGGRLVFVNLPAQLPACLGRDHPARTAILDVPRQLGVDLIDLERPIFDLARKQGAHVVAGDGRCGGHYSAAGYAIVAQALLEYLRIANGDIGLPPSWNANVKPDGARQLIYDGRAHDRSQPLRP